ncbi:MAG: MarR family EPS-associated transcriptional regulator [Gammaproteobacteria bacterium]|nr:MarR family EPS-associated transcriptional regulator [Gammaproteobacteria bacterium]
MSDENRYQLLKLLEENPELSQRQIASVLGISLGKVNFCLRALIKQGWIKAGNFSSNPDKKAYAYLLTLKGIEEKGRVTLRFLAKKQEEYELLEREIDELKNEAKNYR